MKDRGFTDMRHSMRVVTCQQRARQIVAMLRGRMLDAEFIGWPALQQSLKAELDEVLLIGKQRGFDL